MTEKTYFKKLTGKIHFYLNQNFYLRQNFAYEFSFPSSWNHLLLFLILLGPHFQFVMETKRSRQKYGNFSLQENLLTFLFCQLLQYFADDLSNRLQRFQIVFRFIEFSLHFPFFQSHLKKKIISYEIFHVNHKIFKINYLRSFSRPSTSWYSLSFFL